VVSLRRDGDVMEIMTGPKGGRELRQAVLEDGPSAGLAAEWLLQVAEALALVHAAGGVHGQLDGRHVTVDGRGLVQLTDLALADPSLNLSAMDTASLPFQLRMVPSERSDLEAFVGLARELVGFLPELEPLAAALSTAMDGPGEGLDIFDLHTVVSGFLNEPMAPGNGTKTPGESGDEESLKELETPEADGRNDRSRNPRTAWLLALPLLAAVLALVVWHGVPGPAASGTARPGELATSSSRDTRQATAAVESLALPARMERALQALKAGDSEKAGPLLEEILADPALDDPVPALQALGILRLKQGRSAEAASLLERALTLRPSAHLYYATTLAQASTGRVEAARATLREGLERYPQSEALQTLKTKLGGQ